MCEKKKKKKKGELISVSWFDFEISYHSSSAKMKELRGKALMAGITSACSMGFLLFGCKSFGMPLNFAEVLSNQGHHADDQGVMGTILNAETFLKTFNNPSATQQGLITGLYDVGCLVGSILAFLFGERLGRKKSIYIGAVIVVVGTILQATAEVIVHLIVARVFTGVGVGIMTAVVPTWQAEVSQSHNRGAMITIEAVNIIVGFVLSNWISFGASYATTNFQWIFPIAMQAVFALYLLVVGPFLVESPRWLAHHKDIHQATHVLARLLDASEDDPRVQESRAEIEEALRLEAGGSLKEIFTSGGQQNFRRMLLGVLALYFQQMSGINTV